MTRMLWRALLAAAIVFAFVGCGAAATTIPPVAAMSTWDPGTHTFEFGDVLRYRACGSFDFEPRFLEQKGTAEQGSDAIAAALRTHLAKADVEIDSLPDTGWLLAGSNDGAAQFLAPMADGRVASVNLEKGADGWKVTGWGSGCAPSLVLPSGLGSATWRPNPFPDPSARTIDALVSERSCASGASSAGRVVGPAIMYEPDRVLVAFGVIPLAGDFFDCQSNQSSSVRFELTEGLGDRTLIDASLLPWVDVRTLDQLPF